MKKNKQNTSKEPSRKEMVIILIAALLLGTASLYSYFTKDDSVSLIKIQIKFEKLEVEKSRRPRKIRYFIYSDSSKYCINTLFYAAFEKDKFLKDVQQGDIITLTMQQDSPVIIEQLTKKQTKYINEEKRNSISRTDDFAVLLLGCFCLLAVLYCIIKLFGGKRQIIKM